jgi:hypothetical protein
MSNALGRLRLLLAVAVIATIGLRGGIPPILADRRLLADRQEPDFISRTTERYAVLPQALPPNGLIGHLPEEQQTNEAFLRLCIAQNVLSPRVVVAGTSRVYVMAGPESLTPAGGRRGAPRESDRARRFQIAMASVSPCGMTRM